MHIVNKTEGNKKYFDYSNSEVYETLVKNLEKSGMVVTSATLYLEESENVCSLRLDVIALAKQIIEAHYSYVYTFTK